tara:strand:- start:12424 stop:13758 length:1335 start_codon:yes stop_codon:yes gene_type:complete
MSSNRLKVEVNALKEGMFVSDLDRPWHETPFPLQGFYIRLDDDVKALAEYCKYVYVDVQRQKSKVSKLVHAPFDKKTKSIEKKVGAHIVNLPPIVIKSPTTYTVVSSIHKEVSKAVKLHKHVYEAINHVFLSVSGDNPAGLKETVKETELIAEGMVESVIRNPDALVWLAKMNDQDAYSYQHSVKASIWSLVFGRHLGLDKIQLKSLAMGVLLSHIGKAKLSQEVLDGIAASDARYESAYQEYIQHSLKALSTMGNLPRGVIQIVEYHQERHNGTGFPKNVTGEKIPLLAKIAGLVHYYQELITPRNDDLGLSPLAAVSKLFELRNISFQQDLVERFIEAVGVFPTGTLVELSSNEIAIVTGHNQDRRLLPKVIIVLDENKQKLKNVRVVDLKEKNMTGRESDALYIKDSLPKGAYNIDENQYLLSGATSKWSWRHIASSIASN